MSTLMQRFAELQSEKPDISQADLARATGAKPPSVNAWFTGDTKTMKAETAAIAANLYGVNSLWLATGKGQKYAPANSVEKSAQAPDNDGKFAISLEDALSILGDWIETFDDLQRDQVRPLVNRMFDEPQRSAEIIARIIASIDSQITPLDGPNLTPKDKVRAAQVNQAAKMADSFQPFKDAKSKT